jgi:hypothetical protein
MFLVRFSFYRCRLVILCSIVGPHCHLLLCIDHIHEHENLLRYEIEQLINGKIE